MDDIKYLSVGKASDLENRKDRIIYRFFEMLPGLLSWGILFLAVFFSWMRPVWSAIFIIIYSIFWLFRTIYFSLHLWSGYKIMSKREKTDWVEKLNALSPNQYSIPTIKNWKDIYPHTITGESSTEDRTWRDQNPSFGLGVYHLVVIPMYKEPMEIIRGTLGALKKSDYPKNKIIVVLACEERAKDFIFTAVKEIEKEFGAVFLKFMITWHPDGLPGEISGKGANESWAAKEAKVKIIDFFNIPYENIIFSSFDADTCVLPGYFSRLTYCYLTSKNPTKSSFQPVPIFINNIWQAPVISRVFSFSSTFWHTINQERPNKLITFSSHSMSFKALVEVGFKQTNVVSDDSRIFWQCFLKYDGDYRVQPLYYSIFMDANVAKSFWRTIINIYKQQRRWAYGVNDVPYFLFGFLKNKKIPFSKKITLGFNVIEGYISWAVSSILIFMLGWLPLFIGGREFSHTLISYNLPIAVGRLMTLATFGLVLSVYLSFLLLPPKPPEYGRLKYLIFAFSWILFPAIMIFFGSLPSFDAQTRLMLGKYMGFWPTEKVRK